MTIQELTKYASERQFHRFMAFKKVADYLGKQEGGEYGFTWGMLSEEQQNAIMTIAEKYQVDFNPSNEYHLTVFDYERKASEVAKLLPKDM